MKRLSLAFLLFVLSVIVPAIPCDIAPTYNRPIARERHITDRTGLHRHDAIIDF